MKFVELGLSVLMAASPVVCLERRVLELSLEGYIDADLYDRLDKEIVIMVPVECRSRNPLQPKNLEEALQFLDWALPLDLKSSFGQPSHDPDGSKVVIFGSGFYTNYLGADSRSFEFLGSLWESSEYCRNYLAERVDEGPAACAIYAAEEYARWQVPRPPAGLGNGPSSMPPSRKELGLPE